MVGNYGMQKIKKVRMDEEYVPRDVNNKRKNKITHLKLKKARLSKLSTRYEGE